MRSSAQYTSCLRTYSGESARGSEVVCRECAERKIQSTRRRWIGVCSMRSANAKSCVCPITAIDCNLYAFEVSCTNRDTSDSARPVRPSSTHAKLYISPQISAGKRSISNLHSSFNIVIQSAVTADSHNRPAPLSRSSCRLNTGKPENAGKIIKTKWAWSQDGGINHEAKDPVPARVQTFVHYGYLWPLTKKVTLKSTSQKAQNAKSWLAQLPEKTQSLIVSV